MPDTHAYLQNEAQKYFPSNNLTYIFKCRGSFKKETKCNNSMCIQQNYNKQVLLLLLFYYYILIAYDEHHFFQHFKKSFH
jgi:hypothetical protein